MSTDEESDDSDIASVGRARSRMRRVLVWIGPILGGAIITIFRDTILQNIRNIPLVTYGFIIIGIGVASLLYFIIPLTWDIENIRSDLNSLQSDTRLLRKDVKALNTDDSTDTDSDDTDDVRTDGGITAQISDRNILLATTISGIVAGASIGLIGGLPGAVAGALFGVSIGFAAGRVMLNRQTSETAMSKVKSGGGSAIEPPRGRKPSEFQVALVSSDDEVFFVEGERDSVSGVNAEFVEALLPVYLPWRDAEEIISIQLSSTVSRNRSMGDEILYYGSRILDDPESPHDSEIEFDFREYPRGVFDVFEMYVTGKIELLEYEDFEDDVYDMVDTESEGEFDF